MRTVGFLIALMFLLWKPMDGYAQRAEPAVPLDAKVAMSDINIDDVPLNEDYIVTVVIRNIDTEDRELFDVWLTDDVGGVFQLITPQLPIEINVGGTTTVDIIVNIPSPGTYRTRFVALADDDGSSDDTASCLITVTSADTTVPPVKPVFAVGSADVKVGDHLQIPLYCVEGGDWLRDRSLTAITCDVQYRRTILTMDTSVTASLITGPLRTITIQGVVTQFSDTLYLFPMTACLGDTNVSDVVVTNIALLVDTGTIRVDTTISGTVRIKDTWQGTTYRTVSRDTTMPALEVFPNPTPGPFTLSLHACDVDADVRIHAMNGVEVFAWTSPLASGPADHHLVIDRALAPGAYVCSYRSNDHIVHRSFIVLP